MKNTKKFKKNSSKTKKYKNGGRKNNMTSFITQTAGYNSIFGGSSQVGGNPSPAPSSGLAIYNLEVPSLRASLQSYGDAIQSIVESAQTGLDIYQLPPNAPTTYDDETPSYNEILSQYNSSRELKEAADTLKNTFSGPNGLYKTIYGSSAVFVATPSPAPAMSGGQGGTPPSLSPVSGLTVSILQPKLQEFGNAIVNLILIANTSKLLYNTSAPLGDASPSGTTSYIAYTTFKSQQTASESILEALNSTYESFAGTSDYNPTTQTGVRGLYRGLLGDAYNFTPPPLPAEMGVNRVARRRENAEMQVMPTIPAPMTIY